jgi:hypothetical protein
MTRATRGSAGGADRRKTAKPVNWRHLEQRFERSGEGRSSVSQRFIPLAQRLIRRQARKQAVPRLPIELVVNQRDKLGVITWHCQ